MPPELPDSRSVFRGKGRPTDGAPSMQASSEEPSGDGVDLDSGVSIAPALREPEDDEAYVDSLVRASLQLLRKDLPPEVRRHGLKMMQHLLRFRWDELRITEWSAYGDAADMIDGLAAPIDHLPLRSATAALVAQGIWSGGISLVNDFLPSMSSLSKAGPIEVVNVKQIYMVWMGFCQISCLSFLQCICGVGSRGSSCQIWFN